MLCCCEHDEQTASRILSDYNIDLGEEWGVSSVPSLMAKIVGLHQRRYHNYFHHAIPPDLAINDRYPGLGQQQLLFVMHIYIARWLLFTW